MHSYYENRDISTKKAHQSSVTRFEVSGTAFCAPDLFQGDNHQAQI